jgi:hypothetical protein
LETLQFPSYHGSKMHDDAREACTRVPRSRLGAVPRLCPLLDSDNPSYVNLAILDFAGLPRRAFAGESRYAVGISTDAGVSSVCPALRPYHRGCFPAQQPDSCCLLPAGQPASGAPMPGGGSRWCGSTGAPWQCARPRACGPLLSEGTSGSRGWAHSAGGKGCLNFPRNKKAAPPVRRKKLTLTINGLKKWVPDDTFSHELSRPKRVLWLPAYGTM